ncbi:MAG: TRAP transporter fused permease subunit, partial [Gammaproteobacteria bacterium]|nr:TRAP transporter fused permease subunit [Gammaproteobacteria bacterium]
PVHVIPWYDWLAALIASFTAAYLFIFQNQLADRPGAPTSLDLVVGLCGLLLLLDAARRTLGLPLMIVALVFLTYTLAGPYMPDVIAHKGASLSKLMSHQWLGSEGVFGVALGVSTAFVFLFVTFGSLLERAGAGHWFIQVAFSLLGHFRGGPAKAAVVASGMSGIISGSSIANVVTTGTFTIPLMKRVGFPGTKAAAVEVAASTNGQLTPPIMGAAAFLMVEFVGISYLEVIKHALLPALISYVALLYIVHLEALKAGMVGLPREKNITWAMRLAGSLGTFIGLCLLTLIVYYGVGWTRDWLGDAADWALSSVMLVVYLALVAWAAPLTPADEIDEAHMDKVPPIIPTLRTGAYFLLPVVVLIWCLAVERLSPGLSAFWGMSFMIFIVLTHRPLRKMFNGHLWRKAIGHGVADLYHGLTSGSRNMVGIGVATATAGIVVGTVTLTGIGLMMTEFVEFISAGNLMLMLLFTAVISLLLGLGLPTTANYIVVSTLMAPVIVTLGAQHGLVIPLIAVHLFVFYFGILADDTPPVGLAAFAAAAIAKADPIRTGIQGFAYDIRTAILPFMFIFNTQLLLINIGSFWELLLVVGSAIVAMLCFAAATQGWWITRSHKWESALLILIAFSLFRPGFWWDRIYPPVELAAVGQISEMVAASQGEEQIIFDASGMTLEGEEVERRITLRLPAGMEGAQDLANTGMVLREEDGAVFVDSVEFGSVAAKAGLDLDWQIEALVLSAERPAKYWLFIPLSLALIIMALVQRRRSSATAY